MLNLIEVRGESAVTVAELIAALKQMPQDAKIWADGCDCCNPVTGATVDEDGKVTLEVEA